MSNKPESRRKFTRNDPQSRGQIELKWIYQFQIFFLVLTVIVIFYLSYIITQFQASEEPVLRDLAGKSQIAVIFGLAGLIFIPIINDIKKKRTKIEISLGFERREFGIMFFVILIGFAMISVSNYLIFNTIDIPKYDILGFNLLYFSISMAIVEELFFTIICQIFVEMVFNTYIAGYIARPIAFMSYHFAVYGDQPELLFSTFIAGFVLALSFKATKRISTNMFIHAFINGIAYGLSFQAGGGF